MQNSGCLHAASLVKSEAVNAVLWLSARGQPRGLLHLPLLVPLVLGNVSIKAQ